MFSGLMPAMVTPFDERGEVDLQAAEAVVERFIEAGVSGISPLGSTGEFSHLTAEERKRFAEGVVSIVGGRVPVLVGVGAPFYWNVGEEALFAHFAAVARAVGIPVLIYNLPMLTGVDLSPSLVARVAGECPNVVGLKDTVTEYSHTVNVLREVKPGRPDFSVLAGFEDLILPSVLAGGDGSICGLANVAPELFVGMVRCAQNGELEEAAQMHRRVLSLLALGGLGDTPLGAIKLAMNVLGVPISPTVRGPATTLREGKREEAEAILEGVGLAAEA